jgi:hypothetical protein
MERLMVLVMLALVVICIFVTSGLGADEPRPIEESGNAFLRECSAVEKERDFTTVDRAYGLVCSSYVTGFVEGAVFTVDFVRSNGDQKAQAPYCGGGGVEAGQVVKIVLKYVREHPDTAHLRTSVLVGRALQNAFPCRG